MSMTPQPPHPASPSVPSSTGLSPSHSARNQWVTRAAEITDQLSELMAQLAVLKGSELRQRWETINGALPNSNITTARELASGAVMNFTVEMIKLQGEIDTLTLALQHCDRVLTHYTFKD